MQFEVLAARCLNAARVAHRPTYAALRLLLDSMTKDSRTAWDVIARRSLSKAAWKYHYFKSLKEVGKDRKPVYRSCMVGSPLTVAVECYVLHLMALDPAFQVHPRAYSYLWPKAPNSPQNFAYYLNGFEARNAAIRRILEADRSLAVVVADIRNFYPSINRDRILAKVRQRADAAVHRETGERFARFSTDLVSQCKWGIPIGPDLSHVLGHIALEDVDRELTSDYGERYFRYVDDFVVLCPARQAPEVLRRIDTLLNAQGLKLNSDKQEVVDAETWLAKCPAIPLDYPRPGTFEYLTESIRYYLSLHPDRYDTVVKAFADGGFSLPLSMMKPTGANPRYRQVARSLFSQFRRGLGWIAGSALRSLAELVSQGVEVRRNLFAEAQRLASEVAPSGALRRRWYSQRRRYVYNRLLYLTAGEGYSELLRLIPGEPEFEEHKLVIKALLTGDATELAEYPGRIISSFCQLWAVQNGDRPPKFTPLRQNSAPVGESAANLLLYTSASLPVGFLANLAAEAQHTAELLAVCAGEAGHAPGRLVAYLGEVASLIRQINRETLRRLLLTRFSQIEEPVFDAILLSGIGYFVTDYFIP